MKNVNKIISILLLIISGSVLAQPGTTVGIAGTPPGGTVTIPIDYLGTGSTVTGVQMDIQFDNVNLTANIANCGNTLGGTAISCTDNGTFIRLIGVSLTSTEIPTGSLGTIDFTIGAGVVAPASFPLTVANEIYGDAMGNAVVAVGTVNGAVNALAISPQYTSVPAPGTAIAMGSILQGGVNPASSIDITNTGDVGTTLTGTCTAPAPFIVTGGAYSVAQGAAAVTVNVECDSSAAPAAYAEDLTCTHNGSNIMGDVTYPMTCEVLAAAAAGDQNPANGTALSVVVAPGGSATTSVTFSEVGGQGVDITDLTCTVTPGVGFAITSPGAFPTTVPAAGTLPVVVTFTDPGDGSATAGSLDCTYTDGTGAVAVSYPLTFAIRAINVPALSMMGYIALTLGFGLIGFFAFRRRA